MFVKKNKSGRRNSVTDLFRRGEEVQETYDKTNNCDSNQLLPLSCAVSPLPAELMGIVDSRDFASRDAGEEGDFSLGFWCASYPIASVGRGSAVQGSWQHAATNSFPWHSFDLVHSKFWIMATPCVWLLQAPQMAGFQQVPKIRFSSRFLPRRTSAPLYFSESWPCLHHGGLDLSSGLGVEVRKEGVLLWVLFLSHWGTGCVSSSYFNRMSQTGWLKQHIYFSQFWRLKSKLRVLGRNFFQGADCWLLPAPHGRGKRAEGGSPSLMTLIRAQTSFMRASINYLVNAN